jgi:hypothetical protein
MSMGFVDGEARVGRGTAGVVAVALAAMPGGCASDAHAPRDGAALVERTDVPAASARSQAADVPPDETGAAMRPLPVAVPTASRSASYRVTREEVVAWSRQGHSEDVIIDRIERSDSIFHVTAAEEDGLRSQGVSDEVIRVMKQTGRR